MPRVTRNQRRGAAAPRRLIQPRIPGLTRRGVSAAVSEKIERALDREMARYGAARSFVIAVALAYTFDVELDEIEDYHRDTQRKRRR